jgi:aryl-alcohol dehydrogenase-like predicted oxidoreductase
MGIGLAALGRPAYITAGRDADLGPRRDRDAMEERTHQVLDAAFDNGLRYVDVARSYGLAEAFLADWLHNRGVAPRAMTVGSKWGYTYVGEWRIDAPIHEIKDHSLGALRRQMTESRALLGDHLCLYQIHSATLESGVLKDDQVLAALVGYRDEGLVVGLTVSGPRQAEVIRVALDAGVDGVNPFASVQATWNVREPSAGPALAEARDAGWGVIVKEAVANGRLTPSGRDGGNPLLRRMAQDHRAGVDQIALAAALAQPWVDVVLSGAATVDELQSNAGATGLNLAEHELDELTALAEPPTDYWTSRGKIPWT